ncbi:MAG: O-acetyl-ADP-ribose deacetylase [Gammaproteobacteria bacterium]|nr:O-acetyl-ADP-ribose deacetylase [Gammaproteobacteria bacterium]
MKEIKDRIELHKGDITVLEVDAIVNAANTSLLGGGGVDGAIHHMAGPGLKEECRTLRGCAVGEAKITGGHNLAAPFVIHTVGPVFHGGNQGEPDLLASCYQHSLALAEQNNIRTIAFPAISCGAYGFPIEEACYIAVQETVKFLQTNDSIERVIFTSFDDRTQTAYENALVEILK